ncbi:alpha/beta hydrolase [Luteolibacter pohnpeiensis]|uniref:Alpha/beta hydrolase n=1 Tax=Luteolibacter pohnpeiensis TaxID=454153 RepID=A0A934S388_9BACT|nr:alpha/beta fold hydrolase [Luteolibacter pohnpeiensis]MBK1882355.1 alpha/beta hydrolase [Luteolibacter pohnpeiensis]
MDSYIISTRGIRNGLFSIEPGPTRFLKVPANKNPSLLHQITRTQFIEEVIGKPKAQKCDDVVVFIHGYNVKQSELIARHRTIRTNLGNAGYSGAVLSFDWPAKGTAANYLEDRSDARRVALQLVDDCISMFAALVKTGCKVNLHLLAHSTGGFIIREAFDDADDRNKIAKVNWSVSQICFVAADVAAKDMSDASSNSNSLYRHCVRLTNYYNPYDSVLKLSNVKRVGVAPRTGRVGLPLDAPVKAVGVDCGARFLKTHPVTKPILDSVSHGWYFDDTIFYRDLAYTLAGDIDREVIPTRTRSPVLGLVEG